MTATENTPEAFRQRCETIARTLNISFPLIEEELAIKKVTLTFDDGSTKTFWGDSTNRSTRLFLRFFTLEMDGGICPPLEVRPALDQFNRFYGFYWNDRPETGAHPFIDALKHAHSLDYDTRREALDEPRRIIEEAWEDRGNISVETVGEIRDAVAHVLNMLDRGEARVAEPIGDAWQTNQWLKKAVLLSFRLNGNAVMPGPGGANWYDKVPLKFAGWNDARFRVAGFRAVPGSIVRHGAFVDKNVVLMPSFVNIGAHVGEGTMIDTWATVGSCAQIGKNCHISGGAGIGGVLEPLQADPVIIEDDVFIGARSEIAEGVRVGKGSVISMGVFIGASTNIVDRTTREVFRGSVPPYSVVVPGTLGCNGDAFQPALYCAVIVKTVDAQTRAKTAINELLRD